MRFKSVPPTAGLNLNNETFSFKKFVSILGHRLVGYLSKCFLGSCSDKAKNSPARIFFFLKYGLGNLLTIITIRHALSWSVALRYHVWRWGHWNVCCTDLVFVTNDNNRIAAVIIFHWGGELDMASTAARAALPAISASNSSTLRVENCLYLRQLVFRK